MSGNPQRVKEVEALVRRMAARPGGVTARELARAGRMSVSQARRWLARMWDEGEIVADGTRKMTGQGAGPGADVWGMR